MITMNTMMTRGMRLVITDVAVCVLSLVKAFGAVFFLLCLLCIIVLSIFALVDRHSRYKATGKLMGRRESGYFALKDFDGKKVHTIVESATSYLIERRTAVSSRG